MQVFSSVSDSIDQSVIQAFEEQPGLPIRVRVQPAVLRRPETRREYRAWRDLHWVIEVETLDEARDFREAMTLFFDGLNRHGVAALRRHLQATPMPTLTT